MAAQRGALLSRLTVLDVAAVLVWAAGFFFEAMRDAKMDRFKADPASKGEVLSTGVW
jgi:steroid 5-alpha reductase family enzyme